MSQSQDKAARLAAALKANLARRKAQARARSEADPPEHTLPAGREGDDAACKSGIGGGTHEPVIVPDGKAR